MKKIFTLALGLMITAAMFAADRKPVVTITSAKKFQIMVDGRQYVYSGSPITLSNIYGGQHDIKVFKVRPGFIMSAKRLVASSDFQMGRGDVQINIDRQGQINITQANYGGGWNDHDFGRRNSRNDHNRESKRF